MKGYFFELCDYLFGLAKSKEVILCALNGENSDFIRFNKGRIRQAGTVTQYYLDIRLIDGKKHASASISLSGEKGIDYDNSRRSLKNARDKLRYLPEDPYLFYSREIRSEETIHEDRLPRIEEALQDIANFSHGKDLVGIWASGDMMEGFSNSLGQRNWFQAHPFHFDWSLYHRDDKAVKNSYAGVVWDSAYFRNKMESAVSDLETVSRPAKTLAPGKYRVYLSPSALQEFIEMLSGRGFGLKKHQTKTTPLIKMSAENRKLDDSVTLIENVKDGVAPNFQRDGFLKPDGIVLIHNGEYKNCLVSPRSAMEYGVDHNGADDGEGVQSMDMLPGGIAKEEVLSHLDTGVWVNNTWYLNFSDVSACRITGMTRFACFWVEKGKIVAPVHVMRFDESFYRMLGDNLIGLTQDREFILSASTYQKRENTSCRLPGALVKDFTFTL